MNCKTLGILTAAFLIVGSLAAALLIHHTVLAQPAAAPQPVGDFIGPGSCSLCHSAGAQAANLPGIIKVRDFVLLTESPIWFGEDKHAKAFELLRGELGTAILSRMGIEQPLMALDAAEPPQKVRQCLACHANWRMDRPTPAKFHDFKQFGVSCESCHGPASVWREPHEATAWRKLTPEAKREKGMVDVRNPIARAQQCFSCHVGDVKQGKVVTHDMYAAGHPPLPGFELETFARAMPPHWRDLPEKGEFKFKKEFIEANFPKFPHDPSKDLPQTKAVILGGVMALRESVRLVADHAQTANAAAPAEASVVSFPDFAVYDCASCHHDLRPNSWRLERGFKNFAPGRPPMPEWPTALVKLAMRQFAGADQQQYQTAVDRLDAQIDRVRAAVTRRPFGDPQAVVAEANTLIASLDRVAERIAQSRYDQAAAERARDELLRLPESAYPDFHAARQIVWALWIIQSELDAEYPKNFAPSPQDNELTDAARQRGEADVQVWMRWKKNVKEPSVQAVDDLLKQVGLDQELLVDLPAGQNESIQAFQKDYLQAIAEYDPQQFRHGLEDLAAKLPRPARSAP